MKLIALRVNMPIAKWSGSLYVQVEYFEFVVRKYNLFLYLYIFSNIFSIALSATPGSDLQAVRMMLQNLEISKIELRDESSPGK